MKKKLLSIVILVPLLMNFNLISFANEDETEVEPNVYEKQDVQVKSNDGDSLIEKRELPKEQKELTFDKNKATESEQLVDQLFESTIIETNTITSKADKMELFSDVDQELKQDTDKELDSKSSNLLKILMILIVIVIIGLLLIIVPRLQQNQE